MPSVDTFENPQDWQTHVDIRASQEVAMAFCNVKDSLGRQLGNTVDEMARRCVNARVLYKKDAQNGPVECELHKTHTRYGHAKHYWITLADRTRLCAHGAKMFFQKNSVGQGIKTKHLGPKALNGYGDVGFRE